MQNESLFNFSVTPLLSITGHAPPAPPFMFIPFLLLFAVKLIFYAEKIKKLIIHPYPTHTLVEFP
jgi:hypothetical protein